VTGLNIRRDGSVDTRYVPERGRWSRRFEGVHPNPGPVFSMFVYLIHDECGRQLGTLDVESKAASYALTDTEDVFRLHDYFVPTKDAPPAGTHAPGLPNTAGQDGYRGGRRGAEGWWVEEIGGRPYLKWRCGCGQTVVRKARKLVVDIGRAGRVAEEFRI
jgi:hypothetical protein